MGIEAVTSRPERMAEVLTEHEAILDSLERRDQLGAMAALSDHLRATEAVLAGGEAGP